MSTNPPDATPSKLGSGHALTRFFIRLIIFSLFAALSPHTFGKNLADLLSFAVIYCLVAHAMRREAVFGPELTHFDEAAAYAVISYLALRLPL